MYLDCVFYSFAEKYLQGEKKVPPSYNESLVAKLTEAYLTLDENSLNFLDSYCFIYL